MIKKERRSGKERRTEKDRRESGDPNYKDVEHRSGHE